MKKRYFLIVGIILTILSVTVVSAGFFDGLMGGKEAQDNVIQIGNITFNTTNATNFTHFKEHDNSSEGVYETTYYANTEDGGKQGKYTVAIIQYYDGDTAKQALNYFKQQEEGSKSVIDGREVYLTSASVGKYVGEPRYETLIYNADLNQIVTIFSPDANETVKMASTLKFNSK